eukprot:gene35151-43337_t
MRPGWYLDANGQRVEQIMQGADGKQKCLRTILEERGLWQPMPRPTAHDLLSEQPDFKEQRSRCWLREICLNA